MFHYILYFEDIEDEEWLSQSDVQSQSEYGLDNMKQTRTFIRKIDMAFLNMAALIANVAIGFDMRLATGTSNFLKGSLDLNKINSHSLSKPTVHATDSQSYNKAHYFSNTHNNLRQRKRPSVNFDLPLKFTESGYESFLWSPSSDRRPTPSFSAGSHSPRSSSPLRKSSFDNNELVLISLSPSTDKEFVEHQKQMSSSDTGSIFEAFHSAGKSSALSQEMNDDDLLSLKYLSPSKNSGCLASSVTSASSSEVPIFQDSSRCHAGIPAAINPPPPRRSSSQERRLHLHNASAERPVTLDIIARPRPHAGVFKRTSPVHYALGGSPRSKITPTPLETIPSRPEDDTPLPANQILPILDIDVEGQKSDDTKPLSASSRS